MRSIATATLATVLVLLGATGAVGQSAPDHATFTNLLGRYVDDAGRVDYASLKTVADELDAYLKLLEAATPSEAWSREEQLAYYINAYNAATLDLVLEHYPVASIRDIADGKPWDLERVTIGGERYSLNELENDVIRPRFGEPRIHFAINCAAASCPPLRGEAYVAERLDRQLEEQTKAFVTDEAHNRLSGERLSVSRIFDWYGEDFGDVRTFLDTYTPVSPTASLAFREYDWSLNEQP